MSTLVSKWCPVQPLSFDSKGDSALLGAWFQNRRIELWETAAREGNLSEIAALPADWDGCGAEPVSQQAIGHARTVLASLSVADAAPDQIVPSAAGTVLFDWETDFGIAHLEIGRSTFGFYAAPKIGRPIMLGGEIGGLHVEYICSALATIEPTVTKSSLALRTDALVA